MESIYSTTQQTLDFEPQTITSKFEYPSHHRDQFKTFNKETISNASLTLSAMNNDLNEVK